MALTFFWFGIHFRSNRGFVRIVEYTDFGEQQSRSTYQLTETGRETFPAYVQLLEKIACCET